LTLHNGPFHVSAHTLFIPVLHSYHTSLRKLLLVPILQVNREPQESHHRRFSRVSCVSIVLVADGMDNVLAHGFVNKGELGASQTEYGRQQRRYRDNQGKVKRGSARSARVRMKVLYERRLIQYGRIDYLKSTTSKQAPIKFWIAWRLVCWSLIPSRVIR